MGEYSKTIGEIGENIVDNFLNLIGWDKVENNLTLSCQKAVRHAKGNSKQRNTHGIDILFTYKTPLEQNTIQNIIVSVKHTNNSYPNNPKNQFKDYMQDLVQTLECFKHSELKTERKNLFNNIRKHQDIGVLFWLSSNENTYDNLITKIANINLESDWKFDTVHVIDNKKVNFIFNLMKFLRSNNRYEIFFYYPETSLSYQDADIPRYGKVLPVEFLTSPIIPVILKNNSDTEAIDTFCLASSENFDGDSLRRLIKAADEYTAKMNCKYLFLFPNYIASQHEPEVRTALVNVEKPENLISIKSYSPDFRSLYKDE